MGLELGFNAAGQVLVVAPLPGGPADRAGLLPGDTIVEVNGRAMQGSSLYDAAQQLQ